MYSRIYFEERIENQPAASQRLSESIQSPDTKAQLYAASASNAKDDIDHYTKKTDVAYCSRNWLLYIGFILLVLARIWKAYI